MAILALQISLVSAQDLQVGTGADASSKEPAPLNITQNADGTFSSDRDDVNVEFVPADQNTETTTEEGVTTQDVNEIISDIQGATIEEESLFSLRRISKWGGIATAILLMITILMQEKGVGLSSTFGGTGGFYAQKRGAEKFLFRFTILLAVVFTALNLLAMSL